METEAKLNKKSQSELLLRLRTLRSERSKIAYQIKQIKTQISKASKRPPS